jgi:hypothetical protein
MKGQLHATLIPGERDPGNHCIGGYFGLRAGLDLMEERNMTSLVENKTPISRPYSPQPECVNKTSGEYGYLLIRCLEINFTKAILIHAIYFTVLK